MRGPSSFRVLFLGLAMGVTPLAWLFFAKASTNRKTSFEVEVSASRQWTDSGIDLQAGDQLLITAEGTLEYQGANQNGPEGLPRGWRDLLRSFPVNGAGRGALVGRISGRAAASDSDAAEPFLIGPRRELRVTVAGRLFLGVNQQASEQADGRFQVKIEIHPAPASSSNSASSKAQNSNAAPSLPGLTKAFLDRLPLRVADSEGNAGDRVNFLIVGSEDQMHQAFQDAGWVQVDRTVQDAVLHGILASMSKEAYTHMPMSELYLFGRSQDFGLAHAEPVAVVGSRHHLRLWKAPLEVDGQTVWVGAATHDIGFERDQRNNKITHKIDPNIDLEREYVAQSLNQTGLVAKLNYLTPSHPVTQASTATGADFHSDGRTLILILGATTDEHR